MRRIAVALLVVMAACNTPPLALQLELSTGPAASCDTADCGGIVMTCDSVMLIRIFDPNNPTQPFISQCVTVDATSDGTLCPIASVDLEDKPLPEETLTVEIDVFPRDALQPPDGTPTCPTNEIQYSDTTGFPIEGTVNGVPTPALGGRTFYHAGDALTVVTLGCIDKASLVCPLTPTTTFETHVLAFEDGLPATDVAPSLDVHAGIPQPGGEGYTFDPGPDRVSLTRTSDVDFLGTVPITFGPIACVEVNSSDNGTAHAVTCEANFNNAPYLNSPRNFPSFYLSNETLDHVLDALAAHEVPDDGLVVGIVVDQGYVPQSGIHVQPDSGTVTYLAEDHGVYTQDNGGVTTSTGIFFSQSMPFITNGKPNGVTATNAPISTAHVPAGQIHGKVTIAVLQYGSVTPGQ